MTQVQVRLKSHQGELASHLQEAMLLPPVTEDEQAIANLLQAEGLASQQASASVAAAMPLGTKRALRKARNGATAQRGRAATKTAETAATKRKLRRLAMKEPAANPTPTGTPSVQPLPTTTTTTIQLPHFTENSEMIPLSQISSLDLYQFENLFDTFVAPQLALAYFTENQVALVENSITLCFIRLYLIKSEMLNNFRNYCFQNIHPNISLDASVRPISLSAENFLKAFRFAGQRFGLVFQ